MRGACLLGVVLGLGGALVACSRDAAPVEAAGGGRVAVGVAALSLDGVGDVVWDLEVANGGDPAAVVWQKRLASSRYGDGAGSASVVGPCDADPAVADNVVRVWVVGVYREAVSDPGAFAAGAATGVGAVVGDPVPFEDPTASAPLTRTVACAANADAAVTFDVALMRPAEQGFFDVAVSFNDIFCSAKFDCCREPAGATCAVDGSEDLALLFDASGARASTMVLAFACTAGTGDDVETNLYLDPLALDCTSPSAETFAADLVLNPAGPAGNQCVPGDEGMSGCTGAVTEVRPETVDADDYLFQFAIFRGEEALQSGGVAAQKVYWNVALGVKRPAIGSCWLATRATADDALGTPAITQGRVAPGVVYPYVSWSVNLGACGAEALTFGDPDAPVRPRYTSTDGPGLIFTYGHGPHLEAGPFCAEACLHGGQCVGGGCVCPAGFSGDACELASACAAPDPCENGGICAGLDGGGYVCTCVGGYSGTNCEIAPLDCGVTGAPCPVGEFCTGAGVCVPDGTTAGGEPLVIAPATAELEVGTSVTFTATGGTPPYSFYRAYGPGTLSGATYTAASYASNASVFVRDAFGAMDTALIHVYGPIVLTPSSVQVSHTVTLNAQNGVAPYAFAIVSGGGAVAGNQFTAPAERGTVVMHVTDAVGQTLDAPIAITDPLTLSPPTARIPINTTLTYSASGGAGGYVYDLASGDGGMAGAVYTAPPLPGSASVRVTDAEGATRTVPVEIVGALLVSPSRSTVSPGQSVPFTISGGTPPYTFERLSGGGTLSGLTYTAPASSETALLRATDVYGLSRIAEVFTDATLVTPCAPNPCQNGATCVVDPDDAAAFVCVCPAGTSGPTCAVREPCGTLGVACVDGTFCTEGGECLPEGTTPSGDPLVVTPATAEVVVREVVRFAVTGGTPPYRFQVLPGGGGRCLGWTYWSPTWAGQAVVRVSDAFGEYADAVITVRPALRITPREVALALGESVTFSASGGIGAYTYGVSSGGGTLVGSTYTAPFFVGVAYVRVRDTTGHSAVAKVTSNLVTIWPNAPALPAGGDVTFAGRGGQGPYVFELVSGPGSLVGATYTAGLVAAEAVVRVTDAHGWTAETTVTTYSPLTLSPNGVTIEAGSSVVMNADGGLAPYLFSLVSGPGTLEDATFTAPALTGVTALRVTDDLGQTADAAVTTHGPLTLAPSTVRLRSGGVVTFVASGGLPPYTLALVSGGGTLVGADFTAPATAGTSVVRATDAAGAVATATIVTDNYAMIAAGGTSASSSSRYGSTCAVRSDGTLWCWGYNATGQVGDGTTTTRYAPVQVGTEASWASVSVGSSYACAVKSNGSAWCWGSNVAALLGDGTTENRTTPTAVSGTGAWLEVIAGGSLTCGRKTDMSVWCWGQSPVGDGSSVRSLVPVREATSSSWLALDVGYDHACALRHDHTLWCWGGNGNYQVGDGTKTDALVPVQEGTASTSWATLSAGRSYTCATQSDGSRWCWGGNGYYAFGSGSAVSRSVPTEIADADGAQWTSIVAGDYHTCGIRNDQSLWCWGYQPYGAVGDLSLTSRLTPVLAVGGGTWRSVTLGADHTCGVRTDGSVACWGRNNAGQLGYGGGAVKLLPVTLPGTWSEVVSAGGDFACGLAADGRVACWGSNEGGELGIGELNEDFGRLPQEVPLGAVIASHLPRGLGDHACVLATDGAAWCWGLGTAGQLGNGVIGTRMTPTQVVGTGWSALALGDRHTCGLRSDRTLWCWGEGGAGRTGLGSESDTATPTQVGSAADWLLVELGVAFGCGIRQGGALWCWGHNYRGQIGDGSTVNRYLPVAVGTDAVWVAVDGGMYHTCGIQADGSLWCWGYNDSGQLGDGTMVQRLVPTRVGTETRWVSVSLGDNHSCGLKEDGTIWCWGANVLGQLGDGTKTARTSPVPVADAGPWVSVSAGGRATCAVRATGQAACWGYDEFGQASGTGGLIRPYATPVP